MSWDAMRASGCNNTAKTIQREKEKTDQDGLVGDQVVVHPELHLRSAEVASPSSVPIPVPSHCCGVVVCVIRSPARLPATYSTVGIQQSSTNTASATCILS